MNTLYFLAGQPNGTGPARGILGSIAPPSAITSFVNAASQLGGAIAPGELVKISGQTVGPSPAVSATIPPASGNLATVLGGTSATVNGIAAPILYTNGTQTNLQVPYGIAGSTTANIVLTVGAQTATFTAPIAPTAPGLFTTNFSGVGPLVALNADGTINTAANAAARGAAFMVYATGAGVTSPADKEGAAESDTSRVPVAPISLTIGGSNVVLGVNGSFPKSVSGVLQIMGTIPAGIATGAVPVVLTVGGVATTQATTIFVK